MLFYEGLISLRSPINIVHYARPTLFAFFFSFSSQFPVLASEYETDLVMLNTSVCKQGRYEMVFRYVQSTLLPTHLPLPTQLYSHSK